MRLSAPHDELLSSIYVPSLLMAVSNQGMMLVLPLYALSITGDPAYAALVMALRGIGVLLLDVPAGMLAARFGDKGISMGGLVCNINRWRGEVGLAPVTDPTHQPMQESEGDGGKALLFQFNGSGESPQRSLVCMAPRVQVLRFIKMAGPGDPARKPAAAPSVPRGVDGSAIAPRSRCGGCGSSAPAGSPRPPSSSRGRTVSDPWPASGYRRSWPGRG